MTYFEETDSCWLGLDRLGVLGRMTFSLLGAADPVTAHPIEATLAREIGTLVDLHNGALVTDTMDGADVIVATLTTLTSVPPAAARAELIALGNTLTGIR